MNKKELLPADKDPRNPSFSFKNMQNKNVQNSKLFNEYIKNNSVEKVFSGTLWAEGPAFIPHFNTLVWSDIPNNRMLKLFDGKVSEFKNPSNYCNFNTIDKE